ncbi:uncharacterized protein THITE_2142339 [Thermothielavioides terrestris NRRL 8126]|uniref:Peroxin/Ferlin domain-containing protein n=1 Tax=Thermothielavioides terrestris (strain ATCC 38088 / NRRL 8126) TaxID=578455 RepID=G2QTM1_THETT|nr:uncharacterized protein THITE_2142339 [Thermothielavioides terrestris NRRL 8126]AEO64440.1 hypothetical protein THITE_2142339 [Thermothielavioides terrestris NRRL 8126]
MAAFEPWLSHMSPPRMQRGDTLDSSSLHPPSTPSRNDGSATNTTYAAFSPATLSTTTPSATSAAKRRSTILVHQKSPLLLATPPQITRALAYSHPFLLPLNRLVGLITWTTGDPWESFLLVAAFWAAVLYGDIIIRTAGPVVLVLVLIGGMYGRRFSPLSSSGWSEPGLGSADGSASASEAKGAKATRKSKNLKVDGLPDRNAKASNGSAGAGAAGGAGGAAGHKRNQGSISEVTNTRHQKTLDEIVETLREFTARCNILLEPLLELTDFLSTQRTPTSATTRPALTTLFVRILLCTPFWFCLTLPPLRIITTRRVILILGTILLTWHARVIRVTRAILWRSATIRRVLALVTGLQFEGLSKTPSASLAVATGSAASSAASSNKAKSSSSSGPGKASRESELTKALRRARGGRGTGVRFTFIIYENQRRWIALGWTSSLFAYERPAWTDENNNPVPPRHEFELPEVEDGSNMRWQWAEGSRWRVDGVPDEAVMTGDNEEEEWDYDGPGGRMGWIYYDNKWQNGRRGQDGWGRWTRRRKWYRDAELVEADDAAEEETANGAAAAADRSQTPTPTPSAPPRPPGLNPTPAVPTVDLTPSSPGAASFSSSSASNQHHAHPRRSPDEREQDDDRPAAQQDTASLLSTSSRSARFRPPSLRRRVTDASLRSARGSGGGSRRASVSLAAADAAEDDDAAVLDTRARLALHEAPGTEVGSWGVGEEVRMGLE